MKRLAYSLLLGLLIGSPSYCQVDWKTTFHANLTLDAISTWQFRQKGFEEVWNPIAKPFVNNDRWIEAGILCIAEAWAVERLPKKWREISYIVLSIAHGAAVLNNRKYGGTMIPVFQVRF